MEKIIFYSDASNVGGHELMAVQMYRAIKDRFDVTFIISASNSRFQEILTDAGCKFLTVDYCSHRLDILKSFFNTSDVAKLSELIRSMSPDLVVCLQGNIEISFAGIKAAKKAGIAVWSYIPLCQPLKRVSSNRLTGVVKDQLRKVLYSKPDGFVTISDTQADYLKLSGSKKRVIVLRNYIDTSRLVKKDLLAAKTALGLNPARKVVGYVGRLEAHHKGLDRYIEFLTKSSRNYPDITFLFIGDGPLKNQIKKLAADNDNILLHDWTQDLSAVYSAIDVLIMPSRFEGVSLTMLEGAYFGLPIIANSIPEFKEFIPESNLFEIQKDSEFSRILNKCVAGDLSTIEFDPAYSDFDKFRTNAIRTFETILSK